MFPLPPTIPITRPLPILHLSTVTTAIIMEAVTTDLNITAMIDMATVDLAIIAIPEEGTIILAVPVPGGPEGE